MADTEMADRLTAGKKAFQRCSDADQHNRQTALDDIRFSRLEEQWPAEILKQRQLEGRPCLTISKLNAFIRQVVNDARQNKPSIKVHPVDSGADVETADVINGLIRNIEYTSKADVAYDTAIEGSVSGGFAYWRVSLDYAYDDSFDMDLGIKRISNQFSVYGDPDSTEADSSDWNVAFVVDRITRDEFKRRYKGKQNVDGDQVDVDFDSDAWSQDTTWTEDDTVLIAEWWQREEVEREIHQLSNGTVVSKEDLEKDEDLQVALEVRAVQIVTSRVAKSHKVTQTIMSGADILEERVWPGRYIPIIPVYGDEIVLEGKRYFRSLIHSAKDAQSMFNYWRSMATETVALAPRAPWVGPAGFAVEPTKWATANTKSHSYLEFDPKVVAAAGVPPQRQPLDGGVAAGAIQEALGAADDMKAIIGLYDASLGARSNETSGKAIIARQREGDVSTFHFIDNLARAIRHTGCVVIDLIPKVYNTERVVRVMGEDGTPETKQINKAFPKMDENGQPVMQDKVDEFGQPMTDENGKKIQTAVMAMHDLTVGKYDLTVSTGPSFTTRREEAAFQMTEMVRAFPQGAPAIAPELAKNLDWPGAQEIAERFDAMFPLPGKDQVPPQVQQQMQQGMELIQELQRKVQQLEDDKSIDQFNAETDRMKVEGDQRLKEQAQRIDAAKALDAGARNDRQFDRQQQYPARQG
ncbi:portal protein [Shinella sp. JR1-6]|uniref:portal protein n=1 Tax=Shinella sp. JR1-6 TaxID=2527671 RepID=UPI00102D5862|nr:portal protein [Shinella sp. JR1-6]TAA51047.1 hypothetical protein EXZ48_31990 [Shinella sp. JR1-6]